MGGDAAVKAEYGNYYYTIIWFKIWGISIETMLPKNIQRILVLISPPSQQTPLA